MREKKKRRDESYNSSNSGAVRCGSDLAPKRSEMLLVGVPELFVGRPKNPTAWRLLFGEENWHVTL
jgi:hypothetical protein